MSVIEAARAMASKRVEDAARVGELMRRRREEQDERFLQKREEFTTAVEKEFAGCVTRHGQLLYCKFPFENRHKRMVAGVQPANLPGWSIAFEIWNEGDTIVYGANVYCGSEDASRYQANSIPELFKELVLPLSWWV